MKNFKLLLALLFSGFTYLSWSQNLVPNSSFELYSLCPSSPTQYPNITSWQQVSGHAGTADAFNSCGTGLVDVPNNVFGSQNANTGNGYVGISLGGFDQPTYRDREYIQCQLTSPMVAGELYCVSMYVSLGEESRNASDNALEVHFGTTAPVGVGTSDPLTTITPQFQYTSLLDDKVNWVLVSFNYVATGGESYMTIGNFKDGASTNFIGGYSGLYKFIYYYFDDISVVPESDATITPPGLICDGGPALNLTGADPGGTWSGTGITDANAGTFDPTVAGVGTHTITYSIPGLCGDTKMADVVVSTCSLPVELLEFDAQAVDESKVALTWTTVNEINNDFFEIERSRDGTSFGVIGTVDGAGNSNITLHYNDFDNDPYNGVSYYRLKQTDFDGTYTYSDIRTVVFDDLSFVNMYPNPATEDLQFTVLVSDDADLHVHIVDVTGRVIMQEDHFIEAGESTITLNVSNLASGMYTIRVNTNDENHLSKEFIRR